MREQVHLDDPIEGRLARSMQIICIAGLGLVLGTILLRALTVTPFWRLWELIPLILLTGLGLGLVLVRQGRVRECVAVVLGFAVLGLGLLTVLRGLSYTQDLTKLQMILLVFAAFTGGRRVLWLIVFILIGTLAAGATIDLVVGQLPPPQLSLRLWGQALFSFLLILTLILDGFGSTWREALQQSDRRRAELEKASADLDAAEEALRAEVERRTSIESRLAEARRLEALGRLAGGIAHDFNNMLAAVIGFTDLAVSKLKPDDPLQRDLREIESAARGASTLTRQLLAFARRQPGRRSLVRLDQLLTQRLSLLQGALGQGVELALQLEAGPAQVRIDPGQLEQLIVSLALSAREVFSRGAKLVLETRDEHLAEPRDDGRFKLHPGRYVVLSLKQAGVPVSEQALRALFEPFAAGRKNAMGLAPAYGIVQQAQGALYAENVEGGSAFTVLLPGA
jgi:signal transduction histidine kinase